MTGGIWNELAELQDPELQRLAKSLPVTLLHSRSDSTAANYGYAFQVHMNVGQTVFLGP